MRPSMLLLLMMMKSQRVKCKPLNSSQPIVVHTVVNRFYLYLPKEIVEHDQNENKITKSSSTEIR